MKPHAALVLALVVAPQLAPAAFINLTPSPSASGSHLSHKPSTDITDYWYVTNPTSHFAPLSDATTTDVETMLPEEKKPAYEGEATKVKKTVALYAEAILTKTRIQIASNALDTALDSVNQALGADPELSEGYILRGVIAAKKKRHGSAIEDFNRALSYDPESTDAFQCRGTSRLHIGQVAEALADFDRVLQLDPTFAEAYLKRGLVHAKQEKYAAALADFDRYADLKPADPLGQKNRSAALHKLGRKDEATVALRRYLALDRAKKQRTR